MAKIEIEEYLDELKGNLEKKDYDLYSLKAELNKLENSSHVFDALEKESMAISKNALEQIEDMSLLLKIRNLSSEIKEKRNINGMLHSLHFSINAVKNSQNISQLRNAATSFMQEKSGAIRVINELNDFKSKISEIKKHHSRLLPKSLDNNLAFENKRDNIEKLSLLHKKQKELLASSISLFLKTAKTKIRQHKKLITLNKKT